jgi:ABC-type transport system substrate-binding protein
MDGLAMFGRLSKGEYESIYHGFQASSLDPAMNMDFWMSRGSGHVWNFGPPAPWEQTIDDLMQKQVAATSLAERQQLFADVQKVFGEHVPAICFVAPKVWVAMTSRVGGATPVLLDPKLLWNPATLYVAAR